MRKNFLWGVFTLLLILLAMFQTFSSTTGKFQSIAEAGWLLNAHYYTHIQEGHFAHADWQETAILERPALPSYFFGNLLALHNIHISNADSVHWQEEARAHNISPYSFFGTLFKTISPNVFFNIRALILALTLLNLFLFYLLIRNIVSRGVAALAIIITAWIPQFSLSSSHVSAVQLSFFFLLLSLHFLLQWQNFFTSRSQIKSILLTIIAGTFVGYGLAAEFNLAFVMLPLAATGALWHEYRQNLSSRAVLILQMFLMFFTMTATFLLINPSFWHESLRQIGFLWQNITHHIAIERMLSSEAVHPTIFSWIQLSRAFTHDTHALLFWGQQFLPLLFVFAGVLFLASLSRHKESPATSPLQSQERMKRSTLFMTACFFSMFSLGAFLLHADPQALYLFWPWLAVAAAQGLAQMYEALRSKHFTALRLPLLYSLLLCGNVLVCSSSPWFFKVNRLLNQKDPARRIAYLQEIANSSQTPEIFWNQIALINLQERNRLQAKIFALKTLTRHPHNTPARWILQHLHEKELRL